MSVGEINFFINSGQYKEARQLVVSFLKKHEHIDSYSVLNKIYKLKLSEINARSSNRSSSGLFDDPYNLSIETCSRHLKQALLRLDHEN